MSKSLSVRFDEKVIKTKGCWEWVGATISKGYGMIGRELAHRVSYQLFVGEIPSGLFVLHRCDNRSCVNPKHLFLGTNTDNMQDMLTKNRGNKAKGAAVCNAKLTEALVKEIRERSQLVQHKDIAKEYGVTASTIGRVRSRKTWKHI